MYGTSDVKDKYITLVLLFNIYAYIFIGKKKCQGKYADLGDVNYEETS